MEKATIEKYETNMTMLIVWIGSVSMILIATFNLGFRI